MAVSINWGPSLWVSSCNKSPLVLGSILGPSCFWKLSPGTTESSNKVTINSIVNYSVGNIPEWPLIQDWEIS